MSERIARFIAWRLPRHIAYWATVRLWAHGTTGKYGYVVAPEATVSDILQRWIAK